MYAGDIPLILLISGTQYIMSKCDRAKDTASAFLVWTYLSLHFHTWRTSEKIIRCDQRPERYPNMGTSVQHSIFRKINWIGVFFLGKGTIRSMQLQKQMRIERNMHFTSVYLPWSWLPTWCITKVGIYNILKYLLPSAHKQIWSFPHNFNVKYICTHAWRHIVYIICKGCQPRAPSFLFKSIIKPPGIQESRPPGLDWWYQVVAATHLWPLRSLQETTLSGHWFSPKILGEKKKSRQKLEPRIVFPWWLPDTPWKINMDHSHGGLEDHVPF